MHYTLGFVTAVWAGHPIFPDLSNVLPIRCSIP